MPTSLDNDFFKNRSLKLMDGLYFHKNLVRYQSFENQYISLRKKEGRIYSDGIVASLPDIEVSHPLFEEWIMRKKSTKRLVQYLNFRKPKTILEIGCGNGWLIHYINSSVKADCLGIDVNETELRQAVRIFGKKQGLSFIYADIFSELFDKSFADTIILASVLQYFSDAKGLLKRLVNILPFGGQLHLLDTPLYTEKTIQAARERSEKYFSSLDQTEMQFHYFHHQWNVLDTFNFTIRYNPDMFLNKLIRKIDNDSPFPWIIITK